MSDTLAQIDQVARRVERVYLGYQTTLKALLGEFLDRPDAYAPSARGELIHALRVAQNNPFDGIFGHLRSGVDSASSDADTAVAMPMTDEVRQDYSAIEAQSLTAATRKISDAMKMDADTILANFRKVQLAAAMRVAQGIEPRVAFNMVKGGMIVGLSFVRRTRNAAWLTSVYARTVARALMVDTYTETYLLSLLSHGIDVATVPDDNGDPINFSITGSTPDMPTLIEIQVEYLHPNASRLVSKSRLT